MDNDTTKRCTACGVEYPATPEYFYRQKQGKYGVGSQCKQCTLAYQQSRKDYLREYQAGWREKNPEKNCEKSKRWRERHPDRRREYDQKRYWSNPERERARVRDYRIQNPEQAKIARRAYIKTPHGKSVVFKHAHRYRMRKAALPYELTKEQWERCLAYFNYSCAVCGRPQGLWSVIVQDHWKPVAKGGATVVTNIIPICHCLKNGCGCCNSAKSDSEPETWLISRYGKRKVKEILKRINDYFELVSKTE